jgi:hypothetical protein
MGNFEIGRILHLKSEIPKSQVGPVQLKVKWDSGLGPEGRQSVAHGVSRG